MIRSVVREESTSWKRQTKRGGAVHVGGVEQEQRHPFPPKKMHGGTKQTTKLRRVSLPK